MRQQQRWRYFRVSLALVLLCLGACGGEWPFTSGGYIKLDLTCTDDSQCKQFAQEKVCQDGQCICPTPTTTCGSNCVNLQTDGDHCGKCGSKCPDGALCCQGKCCAQGLACCGNACFDLDIDKNNCGACGVKCDEDERCCEGKCTNIVANNQSCGACGNTCPAAKKPIVQEKKQTKNGEEMVFTFKDVVLPSSFTGIMLEIDIYGAYANLLASAEVLINGQPQGIIPGGSQCNKRRVTGHYKRFFLPRSALKDGSLEVKIDLADAVIAQRCQNPRVVVSLSFGLAQCCGGACVDVSDNVEHCGACGNACPVGAVCCGSGCCPKGFDCCDGGCCRTLRREGDSPFTSITTKNSGNLILAASTRGMWIWNFATGQYLGGLNIRGLETIFDDIAFNPVPPVNKPSYLFVSAVNKASRTITMLVGTLPRAVFPIQFTPPQIQQPISTFAWTANAKYFVTGSATDGTVHIFNAINVKGNSRNWQIAYIGNFKGLQQPIVQIKASRDSRWITPISKDGRAGIIEIGRLPSNQVPAKVISAGLGLTIKDLAIHPKGHTLAITAFFTDPQQQDKNHVEFRDLNKPNYPPIGKINDVGSVVYLTYSPDGNILAMGNIRGDIQLWDVNKKQVFAVLRGHKARIHRLAFTPDGKSLISIAQDRGILIWAVPPRTP